MPDTAPQEQTTRFRSIAAAEAIAARYGVAPIRSHLPPEAHAEWDANVVSSPPASDLAAARERLRPSRDGIGPITDWILVLPSTPGDANGQ